MRYNRVLLVNPPYTGTRVKAVFSAGLGYIAEALKTAGLEYDVLDMSLGYTYKDLKNRIANYRPDLVGVSMMSYRYKETYGLISAAKRDFPAIPIAVGGPFMSLLREKVLQDCAAIDFGIILEGEETIVELCTGADPHSIKGLILKIGGRMVNNGERPFIKDLDKIPFPKYENFELERTINRRFNALPIVSSRGCPFECTYCPVKCSIGHSFRARSPESIMEELAYWYQKGYRRFSFADDNFTLIKERVRKLCGLIMKSGMDDLRLSCDNGIRADMADKGLLKLMREAGFYRIALGVEAGNDRILKSLKKSESIETIKTVIRDACGLGYEVDLFFLVGSPGETWRDLQDSFRIALDNPAGIAYFYNIIPFPHTELFGWIEANGKFLKDPDMYLNDYPVLDNSPVFETPDMPLKVRRKALRHAFAITRKTMRRNWAKRLSGLGILGKCLAFIYSSAFVQDIVLRNKALRKMVYRLAYAVIS